MPDFFFQFIIDGVLGYLQNKVYKQKPTTRENMIERIRTEFIYQLFSILQVTISQLFKICKMNKLFIRRILIIYIKRGIFYLKYGVKSYAYVLSRINRKKIEF